MARISKHIFSRKSSKRAFTLIEAVMAATLTAVIFTVLTSVFKAGTKAMDSISKDNELAQHARVTMGRIVSELRYAERGTVFGNNVLQFSTRKLVDNDDDVETIQYGRSVSAGRQYIQRAIDGGAGAVVGGTLIGNVDPIDATLFRSTGYKRSAGILTALVAGDTADMAVAVEVGLEFQDNSGDALNLVSFVTFRN